MSLVMIDVDKFKTAINDVHGHLVGNEVLKFVAAVIKRVTGTRGWCYRWGGDVSETRNPVRWLNKAAASFFLTRGLSLRALPAEDRFPLPR